MKTDKIKITGPKTCRAVYKITRDPEHRFKRPIIMTREKWERIEKMVMREKHNPKNVERNVEDTLDNLFTDTFGDFF